MAASGVPPRAARNASKGTSIAALLVNLGPAIVRGMMASHVDARAAAWLAALMLTACATPEPAAQWESRLRGEAVVLLGEVHDNAEQHRVRLAVLRRAFAAGWRPAIVMEQFDRERQADIDRARRERPRDAQHVIDVAGPKGAGWNWDFYR